MGLPPALAARLAERSLGTARDLFSRTLLDLVELLDLPYETVRFILREVAARITPQPQTVRRGGGRAGLLARSAEGRAGAELRANSGGMRECGELALLICPTSHPPADLHQLEQVLHLMRAAAAQPLHLRTGLAPLDEALFGGLPAGSVTEARAALQGAGPAGWPGCRLGLAARHAARRTAPAMRPPALRRATSRRPAAPPAAHTPPARPALRPRRWWAPRAWARRSCACRRRCWATWSGWGRAPAWRTWTPRRSSAGSGAPGWLACPLPGPCWMGGRQ